MGAGLVHNHDAGVRSFVCEQRRHQAHRSPDGENQNQSSSTVERCRQRCLDAALPERACGVAGDRPEGCRDEDLAAQMQPDARSELRSAAADGEDRKLTVVLPSTRRSPVYDECSPAPAVRNRCV